MPESANINEVGTGRRSANAATGWKQEKERLAWWRRCSGSAGARNSDNECSEEDGGDSSNINRPMAQ